MRGATISAPQAGQLVEARLGRPPQDMLEGAVVLEAWAGLPAREALALGGQLMEAAPVERVASAGRPPARETEPGLLAQEAVLILSVVAIACWSTPLGHSVGVRALAQALVLALPLTLGLQWALRSAFLGRRGGLAQLSERRLLLAIGGTVIAGLLPALLGASGALASALTLTWVGGTIITRRWTLPYGVAVAAATAAMVLGADALFVVQATAAAIAVAVALALRSAGAVMTPAAGGFGRAVVSGGMGAGLGVLLVADQSVGWGVDGLALAVALVPSTVAGFWGGAYLWRFHHMIPQSLSGVAASHGARKGLGRRSLLILAGAVGRLLAATAVLSVAVALAANWLGVALAVSLLVGFGLVALATLLLGLLASVGWDLWGLLAVATGVATEAALSATDTAPVLGGGLIAGASLTALVAAPAAIVLLSRPARTLATTLWIA